MQNPTTVTHCITYREFKALNGALKAACAHYTRRINAVSPAPGISTTDDPGTSERPSIDGPEISAYQTTLSTLNVLAKELDKRSSAPGLIQCELSEAPETDDVENDPYLEITVLSEAAFFIVQGALNAAAYVALDEKKDGYHYRTWLLKRLAWG